jgi:putative membrane protein
VRTGVAVIAFGFAIEKSDLFLLTLLHAASLDASRRSRLEKLSVPSTHYEGLALITVGIALLVVAAVRFVRTEQLLADRAESLIGPVNRQAPEGGSEWKRRR